MLVETELPIATIGYRCGFAEPSYFSKQFKNLIGVLPSQYREQVSTAPEQAPKE